MPEYIERGTGVSIFRAKANMAVLMDAAPYFEKAAKMLEQLPTVDAVVVIRCKDCRHSYEDIDGLVCGHGTCVDCIVREDFFCADGAKREEAKRNEKGD